MEDAPTTHQVNNDALERQRIARQRKLKLEKELVLENAKESHQLALFYHEMYHLPVCWKDEEQVDKGLKRIKGKGKRLDALKENIKLRVIGFGWKEFKHAWSKDGHPYSEEHLAAHLKSIIRTEKTTVIPDMPYIEIPSHIETPVLGKLTLHVKELDINFISEHDKFHKAVCKL